ncbi:DUF3152 domain-containing protein [Streptomyces sp. XM4193]|uniref:DUF3152 domain-containing protein n=1 Tax=Streptomyces sp. XM4193 TaxID=2929782 RepID=UPI001FFA37F8|nr:DUF3152 domain-containing protein [Streptomyces sp. XM4193]MCK1796066.1 DUF3152 domain-containing protein [Streptomyces sp. XM4193]
MSEGPDQVPAPQQAAEGRPRSAPQGQAGERSFATGAPERSRSASDSFDGFDPRSRPARAGHPQHREDAPRAAGPAVPSQRSAGPRQDYLDAFDRRPFGDTPAGGTSALDDVFAAGAPVRRRNPHGSGPASAGTGPTAVPPSGATSRGAGDAPEFPGIPAQSEGPHGPHRPPRQSHTEEPEEPEVSRNDFAKGRRGRTVTGIAAAAITTVLTVIVAGQVASGDDDSRGQAAGDGSDRPAEDSASRSEGRPTPSEPAPSATPSPVGYEQQMAALLPMKPDHEGSGEFTAIAGGNKGPGVGTKFRYRVDVEKGLGLDGKLLARAVHTTLNDDRSWANGGERDFERVSSGKADFVVTLASPGTTAVWCAKSGLDTTEDNVSCDSAATDRIMINAYRWARGAKTFGDSRMFAYRQMLINHEVGHRLGFNHVGCSKEGALAPVMMQQTKYLSTDGRTCRPNAWPHPDA